MMDTGVISQMLRESKLRGNLRDHPLAGRFGLGGRQNSGFMMGADDGTPAIPSLGQGGGLGEFENLVAMAQAQAEMSLTANSASPETARSLAQMRAMSIQNEMLQGLVSQDQGGENRAMDLIRQVNAEAILSSGNFGNLQGVSKNRIGFDTGRTFNKAEMNSWRQKNSILRETPPEEASPEVNAVGSAEELEAAQRRRDDGLKMPYGQIHAPRRPASDRGWTVKNAAGAESAGRTTVETTASRPQAAEKPAAGPAESEVLAAQKKDAESSAEKSAFSRDDLNRLVDRVAKALDIDSALIMAVIKTESNFDHQAVSRVGAKGLMQLMPGTASDLGVEDPFNPVENVWGGARYLKQMLDRHNGNVDKALASYNWGPGNFSRYQKKGGKMPNETRNYIVRVNQHYTNFKQDNA